MNNFTKKIYQSKAIGMVLRTFLYSFRKELKDCQTVLDLGCGYISPVQYCKNIKYSLGVEAFEPYLTESKRKGIHSEYLHKKIEEVDFPADSFDAVIMIEVLEHLNEEDGLAILEKAERWVRKKILITSPNGFFPQEEADNNPLQKHQSGWEYAKMKKLGFKSYGSGGLKFFRNKLQTGKYEGKLGRTVELFWKILSVLSQSIIFFFPRSAFSLLSVKTKKK